MENNLNVDEAGFDAELQQQKAKAEALLADPALFSDKNKKGRQDH
jgi:hypothetical protein